MKSAKLSTIAEDVLPASTTRCTCAMPVIKLLSGRALERASLVRQQPGDVSETTLDDRANLKVNNQLRNWHARESAGHILGVVSTSVIAVAASRLAWGRAQYCVPNAWHRRRSQDEHGARGLFGKKGQEKKKGVFRPSYQNSGPSISLHFPGCLLFFLFVGG